MQENKTAPGAQPDYENLDKVASTTQAANENDSVESKTPPAEISAESDLCATPEAAPAHTPPASSAPTPVDSTMGAIMKARKSARDVAQLVKPGKRQIAISVKRASDTQEYLRVRPGEEWSFEMNTFRLFDPKVTGEQSYLLVHPNIEDFVESKKALAAAAKWYGLAFAVNAEGRPHFLPLNVNDTSDWGKTAREAVESLKSQWGMVLNGGGNWIVQPPESDLGDPIWPEGTPEQWLLKAFEGRIVDSEDHPLIKKRLGIKA